MSFQSVLPKSDHKNNSSFQLSDNFYRIRATVDKSIGEDLPLLRSNIGFPQLTQSIPELKKVTKNQMITESEIKTKFDEMTSILEESGEDHNEDNPNITLNFDQLIKRTDRLVKLWPTFKRIADNFEEMSEKQSNNKNNCFDRKPIDIIDDNINCLVKTGHQIQHFQQSNNYLKSLTKK